jgi:hypothetical protein
MAKQTGNTIITRTIDDLVFYKMNGKGYVRMKSSLTGKQFRTQKRFANSRKSATRFKTANIMAGEVYRNMPADKRKYAFFCLLKTTAIRLLKIDTPEQEVKAHLEKLSSGSTIS